MGKAMKCDRCKLECQNAAACKSCSSLLCLACQSRGCCYKTPAGVDHAVQIGPTNNNTTDDDPTDEFDVIPSHEVGGEGAAN